MKGRSGHSGPRLAGTKALLTGVGAQGLAELDAWYSSLLTHWLIGSLHKYYEFYPRSQEKELRQVLLMVMVSSTAVGQSVVN